VTDSFWRDPPWRGGKGGYRMGLRPIAPHLWLPDPIADDERVRKQRLIGDPDSGVFAELDCSRTGQEKILDAVRKAFNVQHQPLRDSGAPLVVASLMVPDDLCLMERDVDSYRLTAACVCSPSYWLLANKIGHTLDGIHGPVPTLNEKLGPTMLQFFSRLPEAAVFERRNWLMHTNPEPYQPHSEAWHDVADADVDTLIIRSERQTLRRLDSHTVVFTIRVTCHPLHEIVGFPEAARDLVAALDTLDGAEREAKGHRHFAPAVVRYLRSVI